MKRTASAFALALLILTACADDDPVSSATDSTAPPTTSADRADAPAFEPTSCFPAPGLTEGVDIRCGIVSAPMGATGTGEVSLFVTVVGDVDPIDAATPIDRVLVHVPGGPGASAEPYAPILASTYLPLARSIERPIVFVDQRGTGRSSPFLECDDLGQVAGCLGQWESDGIDPLAFTTTRAAEDIIVVADALGAGQVDLWDASYGSRLALEMLRNHGDRVRSLTIEAVDTAASPLDDALDIRAALGRAGDECSLDPACAALVPDLVAAVDQTAEALTTDPLITELGDIDALTFLTTLESLMQWARGTSYLPAFVAAVRDRDVPAAEAVLISVSLAPSPGGRFSEAMFRLVNCTDLTPFDPAATVDALPLADDDLLGRTRASSDRGTYADACAGWPVAPDAPVEPVDSDVPTLVIAGAIDSNTPLENAELAASTLSSATLVSFPSTGHFPAHQGGNACALAIVADFVGEPTGEVDTSCVPAPATVATLPSPDETQLATSTIPAVGIAAGVPQGWLSLDGSTYATAGAALRILLVPGDLDEVAAALAEQLGIDSSSATEQTIAGAVWTMLAGEVDGSASIVMLVEADSSVLTVVVVTEDGTDPATIAVPVVESITPL